MSGGGDDDDDDDREGSLWGSLYFISTFMSPFFDVKVDRSPARNIIIKTTNVKCKNQGNGHSSAIS